MLQEDHTTDKAMQLSFLSAVSVPVCVLLYVSFSLYQSTSNADLHLQTLTLPKPLVEFANKPMIEHQVAALAAAGVTNIVLAVNYRPEIMTAALAKVRTPRSISLDRATPDTCTVRATIQCQDRLLSRDRTSRHRRTSEARREDSR